MKYLSTYKLFESKSWGDVLEVDDFIKFCELNPEKIKNIDYFQIEISRNETIRESVSQQSIKFNKQPRKKGAKTDVYNVVKSGTTIGQVKWSSRMRGYAFLPTSDCDSEIKEFVKELMRKRREEKKKDK